jgi:hypothetical protein
MPSLDELEAGVARLQAAYKTLTVTFEYYPDRVGMNMQRAIAAVMRPPHDMGPIADELALVLCGWDLTRNGEAIEITPEGVGSLGMGLSSAIGAAIMEDFHDPKSPRSTASMFASSTDSPPGSRPASSGPAPSGPMSSSARNGRGSTLPTSPASLAPVGA